MSDHSFEFEAFQDNFTPVNDEFGDWPSMEVEMTVRWHPAEPDVGIFSSQPELSSIAYYLDGTRYLKEDEFVDAVYALISDEIEETREAVAKAINEQVSEWEGELEEGE